MIYEALFKMKKMISVFSPETKRGIIWFCFKIGMTQTQALDNLIAVYGQEAPSLSTISNWYRNFSEGKIVLEDEEKPGRPPIPNAAEEIRTFLNKFPYSSARQISIATGISKTRVLGVLHDELHLHHFMVRWVPHSLSDLQKSNRVEICRQLLIELKIMTPTGRSYIMTSDESWFLLNNPYHSKWAIDQKSAGSRPRTTIGSEKSLLAIFWSFTGFYYVHAVPEGSRYNSDFIIDSLLPGIEEKISETRPVLRMAKTKLHWDNARPHIAAKTLEQLAARNVILLPHPPYSPDVAPSDFFLFGYLKNCIEGMVFQDSDELVSTIWELLIAIPQETLDRVFIEWIVRLETVVANGGEYINP